LSDQQEVAFYHLLFWPSGTHVAALQHYLSGIPTTSDNLSQTIENSEAAVMSLACMALMFSTKVNDFYLTVSVDKSISSI